MGQLQRMPIQLTWSFSISPSHLSPMLLFLLLILSKIQPHSAFTSSSSLQHGHRRHHFLRINQINSLVVTQKNSRINFKKNEHEIQSSVNDGRRGRQLMKIQKQQKQTSNPNHVAFICDGNSRWSIQNQETQRNGKEIYNRNTIRGHSQGASNVMNIVKHIRNNYSSSIRYITMYAFSTENWSRDPQEVNDLWYIMEKFSKEFYSRAIELNIRVKIIGDLNDDRIPSSLRDFLKKLEFDTYSSFRQKKDDSDNYHGLTVCIAINYGGRKDIINASLKMAELVARGEIMVDQYNYGDKNDCQEIEKLFSNLLYTSDIPDPDLVIRTGGERRLSNFLTWNTAYSELYFTDTLWPEFSEKDVDTAIEWYTKRERRYGGRNEQLES